MRGATVKEFQTLIGHKDMKITNRYAHLSPEHKKKTVNLLNGLPARTKKADSHELITNSKSTSDSTDLAY